MFEKFAEQDAKIGKTLSNKDDFLSYMFKSITEQMDFHQQQFESLNGLIELIDEAHKDLGISQQHGR